MPQPPDVIATKATDSFDPFHHRGIFVRDMVGIERRTEGGTNAGRRREIFNADRDAVEQTEIVAGHHGLFRALRRSHRRFGRKRADRWD